MVLLAALLPRLYALGTAEFRWDQTLLLEVAQRGLTGGGFDLLSTNSSVGVPGPTGASYALAPPLLLTPEPLAVNLYLALIHTLAAAAVWWSGRRLAGPVAGLAGPAAGLAAGLAFAFNPWAIHFSRFVWAPNVQLAFLPPLIALALLAGLDGRRWARWAFGLWLAATLYITVYAWALLPGLGWLLWATRRRWGGVGGLAAVAALVAALLLPFLIAFAGWATARPAGALSSARPLAPTVEPLARTLNILTGLNAEFEYLRYVGEETTALFEPILPNAARALWLTVAGLAVIGAVALLRQPGTRPAAAGLLLALLTPALLFIPGFLRSYIHYFIAAIPIGALFVGAGVAALMQRRALAVAACASLALTWGMGLWTLAVAIGRYDSEPIGLSAPLTRTLAARPALLNADDVLIIGGATGASGHDVWQTLLYPRSYNGAMCLREVVVASGGVAVLPAHPFTALIAPEASDALLLALYGAASAEVVPLRPGEGAYRIARFSGPPDAEGIPAWAPIDPVPFTNGATLIGFGLDEGHVVTAWRLERGAGDDVQMFAHLLDAAGERIGQRDSSFYPGRFWCQGDVVVLWNDLTRPAEAAVLRLGLYPGPGAAPGAIDAVEPGGGLAPWVDLPLG